MKHLLILLSILLLSSPVIGQSTSKYESVNQCVLQTMMEMKLTGNKMFEMVKEECEKYFEKLKKRKGFCFLLIGIGNWVGMRMVMRKRMGNMWVKLKI